jgi:hypothetical protein
MFQCFRVSEFQGFRVSGFEKFEKFSRVWGQSFKFLRLSKGMRQKLIFRDTRNFQLKTVELCILNYFPNTVTQFL